MSHEIDGNRAIYSRTPAWHRLGVVKDDGWMTADECLAQLNPNNEPVRKVTAYAKVMVPDGNGGMTEAYVESDEKVALVERHPDYPNDPTKFRILSFMDREYGVVQIEEQFRFLDEVVGQIGGSHYASAARLRKGKQTIVTIDTGQISLDPNGIDDRVDRYIFGSNSFDGSWAFRVKMVPNRVDCANMAAVALRHQTAADWSTKHTKNIMDRTAAAKITLGLYNDYFESWIADAEMMIETPITDGAFNRILEGLFSTPDVPEPLKDKDREIIGDIKTTYELSPTCSKLHGTVWGALNSVTEWSDWYSKIRGGKATDVTEARLRRQMGETDKGLKQQAWDTFYGWATEHPRPVSVSV